MEIGNSKILADKSGFKSNPIQEQKEIIYQDTQPQSPKVLKDFSGYYNTGQVTQ